MIRKLTLDRLKQLIHYNPNTGVFTWLAPTFGRRKAGKAAGYLRKDGYIALQVDGSLCFAHRLAWLYMHGEWPAVQIDHINRNRIDNRINNLRLASSQLNQQNRGIAKNNTSGISGVYWAAERKKWVVQIKHNRKPRYVGRYDRLEDAKLAREIAEIFYWRAP